MTARINELDDEIEHWRLLGRESEGRMTDLLASLQSAQERIKTLESSKAVPCFLFIFPRTLRIRLLNWRRACCCKPTN